MSQPTQQTIKLETPIKRGETEITEITIRKPNTGALRGVSLAELMQMHTDAILTVLPRVTEPALIANECANLDLPDLLQCGAVLSNFLLPKELQYQST